MGVDRRLARSSGGHQLARRIDDAAAGRLVTGTHHLVDNVSLTRLPTHSETTSLVIEITSKETAEEIAGATALVTGATRGIGKHFVEELVRRGARRVYAGTRTSPAGGEDDGRVIPVHLDVRDPRLLGLAVERCPDVDLLINNAGVLTFGPPLDSTIDDLRTEMETNYFGLVQTTQAVTETLAKNAPAAVCNVLTIIALAPMIPMAGYCASQAAAHSYTQALRGALAPRGVRVHGSFPGGIDTDMLAAVDGPKANPAAVAARTLDGVEAGIGDITPEDFSQQMYRLWQEDPKGLELKMLA